MKKTNMAALAAMAVCALGASAQSAVDALQVTQPGFRGTARFMSMGGAFSALGGDLSTLTQNPGGIGVYRSSEVGATLDLSFGSTDGGAAKNDITKFGCNNFGYVGTAKISGGPLKFLSWGVSYNRLAQFDRHTTSYGASTPTSLTDYVAAYTSRVGYDASKMEFDNSSNYNPYRDTDYDWLSILSYTSYMINVMPGGNGYTGLSQDGTYGDAFIDVHEKGHVDEYSFNLGGNFSDMLYWGIGVGVTEMNYTREVNYSESMEDALIYSGPTSRLTTGNAGFELDNYKRISGSGWKASFGLIFKPISQLRIGAAVHTPTYWNLDQDFEGSTSYSYLDPQFNDGRDNPRRGSEYTDYASFSWRLKSPWRFMLGVAGVIGNKAIVSLDYERVAYNDMTVKEPAYDYYGYEDGYVNKDEVNGDIKRYCRAGNIIRLGVEYRVTPKFSVRAGYNYQTGNIKDETADNTRHDIEVYTSGTDPSFSFDKGITNISVGAGYKFGSWYVDAAYVHTTRNSTLHAYTDWAGYEAPSFAVSQKNSQAVLSVGFRF